MAALACRNEGTRLFGKPLQRLDREVTILDQILNAIARFPIIEETCLGISEGSANIAFQELAEVRCLPYVVGSRNDVLGRLVSCGLKTQATDIFRVTTECPFFHYEMLPVAWTTHVSTAADITVCDPVPDGLGFEIYTLDALRRSHEEGNESDRSEYCSNFARRNRHLFKINILAPDKALQRLDLRVTVDNPEDLILCRAVYGQFVESAPLIPLAKIVGFLDRQPRLKDLVAPYVNPVPVWAVTAGTER